MRSRPLRGLRLPHGVAIIDFLRSCPLNPLDTMVYLDGDLVGDQQLIWSYHLSVFILVTSE